MHLPRAQAWLGLVAIAVLCGPAVLGAQQTSTRLVIQPELHLDVPVSVTPQVAAEQAGPVFVQAGVTLPALSLGDAEALQGPRERRNIRWMVVGGVMLVGGAIVGGDVGTIVSVTGLVIGGVGLYRYLQ